MVIKTGRYGRFLACTGYNAPDNPCDNRRNIVKKSDVPLSRSAVVISWSAAPENRGRPFWGCANYPDLRLSGQHRAVDGALPRV